MIPLTPGQSRCLAAIRKLTTPEGVSPSLEEIAQEIGVKSKANAHRLVLELQTRGYLTTIPGRQRSIALLGSKIDPLTLSAMSTSELKDLSRQVFDILQQRAAA